MFTATLGIFELMSRLLIVVMDHWGDEAPLRGDRRFSPSILVAKKLEAQLKVKPQEQEQEQNLSILYS